MLVLESPKYREVETGQLGTQLWVTGSAKVGQFGPGSSQVFVLSVPYVPEAQPL